jgi:uncharacterized protein YciI
MVSPRMTTAQTTTADPSALLARMMKKELFVILNTPLVEPADLRAHLVEHLNYMIELEKRGVLFASGPFSGPDGRPTGSGLTIVRAASFEEAEAIANGDPFAKAGLRRSEIRRWTVNEGRIHVSVDLSDCQGTLP